MDAMFEMPISSETLNQEELAAITGGTRRKDQLDWLQRNRWVHYTNRAGAPVVGRLYARLKLSGISPGKMMDASGWDMDLEKVR